MLNALANVFTVENAFFLLAGLLLTIALSVTVVLLSILFGTILGMTRNYAKNIAGRIAGIYIEIFRNTPLLIWILACCFMIPVGTVVFRGGLALTLYTSAVIAEIVRGGLNAVSSSQFEAAKSQGFTFVQTLYYIVMPQCFKSIVPSLLSQVVTTIKDTSFLQIVAIPEFTRSGFVVMGRYTQTAEVFSIFAILALGYFLICFTLSCVVRRFQREKKA